MTYGIAHQPLLATVAQNRRRPDQVVAFIGQQICFFERGTPLPKAGQTVEVMITRPQYGQLEGGYRDSARLMGLMIQVVDPAKHMLVAIDGFETSGSMCATSATGCPTDGARPLVRDDLYRGRGRDVRELRDSFTITPGRSDIRDASNINARFYGRDPEPRVPTNVWVDADLATGKAMRRARVPGDRPTVRVAGLTRVEDLACASLVRQARAAA